MTDKTPRKPVAGSRVPTSAPRRIAGRAPRATDAGPEATAAEEPQVATETDAAAASAVADSGASASSDTGSIDGSDGDTTSSNPVTDDADDTAGRATRPGLLSRRRTTTVLSAVAALLTLAIVAGLATSWLASREDDADTAHVLAFDKPYAVAEEPVKVPVADWNSANTAAEKAVTEIF
ncbi:MAG TPA: hypothetical protein VIR30_04605, partial [Nocardioides sp.]